MFLERSRRFRTRLTDFRKRYTGAEGLFWIKRVNHPIGAVIALLLLPTRVTPNMVSVAGLVVHSLAGTVLLASPLPVSPPLALALIGAWQLAFSLDCADGQLARARGRSSPFGAFLDQVIDVASHAVLYTALTTFVVRSLGLPGLSAAFLVSLVFSSSYLQLYTAWGREATMGREPAHRGPPSLPLRVLLRGRHLLDYGLYLFLAGALLMSPVLMLTFLITTSAIFGVASAAQIAVNWHRFVTDSRSREARSDSTGA